LQGKWGFQIETRSVRPDRLSAARRAGFDGVELVGALNERKARETRRLLDDHGLKALALWEAAGPEARLAKCGILGVEYVPASTVSEAERLHRAGKDFRIVVYNRVGPQGCGSGPLETDFEFWRALQVLDFAGLLLNLAHLTIASQSLETIISKYRERLVAVHFADWTCVSGIGKGYEEGFCRMGAGAVELEKALVRLDEVGFDGWCVVGSGHGRREPTDEAIEGMEYLRSLGRPVT